MRSFCVAYTKNLQNVIKGSLG